MVFLILYTCFLTFTYISIVWLLSMAFVCTTLNLGISGTAWHKVVKRITHNNYYQLLHPKQECMV